MELFVELLFYIDCQYCNKVVVGVLLMFVYWCLNVDGYVLLLVMYMMKGGWYFMVLSQYVVMCMLEVGCLIDWVLFYFYDVV